MGANEDSVKRARQNALLRRQVAESTMASHGGRRDEPRGVNLRSARAETARERNVPEVRVHRPSGALSARGRDVIGLEKVNADSATSTLSTELSSELDSRPPTLTLAPAGMQQLRGGFESPRNSGVSTVQAETPRGSLQSDRTSVPTLKLHGVEVPGGAQPRSSAVVSRDRGSVMSQPGTLGRPEKPTPSPTRSSMMPRLMPRQSAMPRYSSVPRAPRGTVMSMQRDSSPGLQVPPGMPRQTSKERLTRAHSKERLSFRSYRQGKLLTEPTPRSEGRKETEEERLKRLSKRYGFSTEEEVKRVLSYFHAACESSGSDVEAGLPVQGLRDWIRGFSGVDESQSVSHLIDPDWPQEKLLSEEEFFAWYTRSQWTEEIMVPDPLERRLRHFCRTQGYHITDVERVKAAFDKADKDGSGVLDQQEFALCYAHLSKISLVDVVESKFRILWEEVDEDHNGFIDLLEFAKWYLSLYAPQPRQGGLAVKSSRRRRTSLTRVA